MCQRRGVQPSPKKVNTVIEWPQLQLVKDVCNFLGLVGFYRQFIPNFSLKARPWTDLTKDRIRWQWPEKEEQAF